MVDPATDYQEFWRQEQEARELRRELEASAPLKGGGGDGTFMPMAEDALKPRVDFLHTAFLWLTGALVTVVLGLAVLIWNVSASIGGRIDAGAATTSSLNREVGQVSTKIDAVNQRLDRIDAKLDKISDKLDKR